MTDRSARRDSVWGVAPEDTIWGLIDSSWGLLARDTGWNTLPVGAGHP
ncbi:hypothetical protein ACFVZ3_30345 [Kitasatospora purpeofusca]